MKPSCARSNLPKYIELYWQGRRPANRLITHRLSRGDINPGMDRLRDGTTIRQIVMMQGWRPAGVQISATSTSMQLRLSSGMLMARRQVRFCGNG
jgi:hypothetical protein